MQALLEIGLGNALAATVLAAVAAVGTRVWRHAGAAHALWLLVLLKLLTPPLVSFPVSWETTDLSAENMPPSNDLVRQPEPAPLDRTVLVAHLQHLEQSSADAVDQRTGFTLGLGEAIALVWLAGSALWFCWTVAHLIRFCRLLRHADRTPAELQQRVEELARQIGLGRAPLLMLLPGQLSPMVWSFLGRPRLLFPAGLLDRVSSVQLDTLILHELAHLARRDHWVRWLELLTSGLYWWLPVVWLARRALHTAEEECCDARVAQALPHSGHDYALALVHTLAFLSPTRSRLPAIASGIGAVSQIKRRLTMILCNRPNHTLSREGGAAVLALGLILLPWAPSLAQQPAKQPPAPRDIRQQQIELLRQLIKTLEEQQRAEEKAADVVRVRSEAARALGLFLSQPPPAPDPRQVKKYPDNVNPDDPKLKETQRLKIAIDAAQANIDAAKAKIAVLEAQLKALLDEFDRLSKATLAPKSSSAQTGEGVFEVIRLKFSMVTDVAKVLEEAFNGPKKKDDSMPRKERIRVVADPITNSLLIHANEIDLRTIRSLLEKGLDVGQPKK